MSSEERDFIIKSINEYNNAMVAKSDFQHHNNNLNNNLNNTKPIGRVKSSKQTNGKHYVSVPSETPRPDIDNSDDTSDISSSVSLSPLPTTDSDIISPRSYPSSPLSVSSPISPKEIKFDNTRHVRVSRMSVGGDNVLPPELLATHKHDTKLNIPWKKIITNGGVLAMYYDYYYYYIDFNCIFHMIGYFTHY